jgi:hypothetical protein
MVESSKITRWSERLSRGSGEKTKADAIVSTLRDAVKVCLANASNPVHELSDRPLNKDLAEA